MEYILKGDKCMPIKVIDLFCGIGGLTHGLIMSGLNVVAGIDIEESCKYAYEQNNSAKFINKDINEITKEEIFQYFDHDDIRVLVGCAPCQPFSKYTKRYRKEGHNGDKWRLLYTFSNLIKSIEPHIVSMENVPELIKEDVFTDFVELLRRQGYYVSFSIVYCPDYGVPQHRRRLILLASKMGQINLIPPILTPENYVTVRDAIGSLEPIKDGGCSNTDIMHQASRLTEINKKRIQQSIPGRTWRDWDEELQLECHKKNTGRSYPSVYGRMLWDRPSPTITTQFYGLGNGRFGHPEQDRALSLREGAILQSFPVDYKFISNEKSLNKRKLGMHIGNAVPVELGRVVGLSIIRHLRR